ncbi:hypothetical protein [Alistipes communis]|uniref:hypothetical protein n=1 Tax=Alistipes communis TaxID=2585118 RepID=UPI003AF06F10
MKFLPQAEDVPAAGGRRSCRRRKTFLPPAKKPVPRRPGVGAIRPQLFSGKTYNLPIFYLYLPRRHF